MDIGTASPLEIVWTSLAALGLALWLWAIVTAIRDSAAIRTRATYQRRGPRAMIIQGRLWSAVLDAGVQAAFLALGVGAMLTPPPVHPANQDEAIRGGLLLIGIEGLLLAKTLVAYAMRRRIDRALVRHTDTPEEKAR